MGGDPYMEVRNGLTTAVDFIEERPIDITEGSTHYHSIKVNPNWASHLEKVVQIEEHIFYRQ